MEEGEDSLLASAEIGLGGVTIDTESFSSFSSSSLDPPKRFKKVLLSLEVLDSCERDMMPDCCCGRR